jgi:hypothetical protein
MHLDILHARHIDSLSLLRYIVLLRRGWYLNASNARGSVIARWPGDYKCSAETQTQGSVVTVCL